MKQTLSVGSMGECKRAEFTVYHLKKVLINLGTVGGLLLLYFWKPFFRRIDQSIPRFLYTRNGGLLLRLGFLFGCTQIGDYWAVTSRYHANQDVPNMVYSNRDFIMAKNAFLQHFDIFNRKFTERETEQFNYNRILLSGKPRRHIYNPSIHGDEESWAKKVASLKGNNVGYATHEFRNLIETTNREALLRDGSVTVKPYDLTQHIDPSGKKLGLKQIFFTKPGRPLD